MDLRRAWSMIYQVVDDNLIAICGDYENRPPRRRDGSIAWPLARLMVVGIMAALFLSLLVESYKMSNGSFTKRVYREDIFSHEQSLFNVTADGLTNGFYNKADLSVSVICPCQNVVLSQSAFLAFFILNVEEAQDSRLSRNVIHNATSFCNLARSAFWNESNNAKIHLSESFCAAINDTLGDFLFANILDSLSGRYNNFEISDLRQGFLNPVVLDKRPLIMASVSQILNMLARKKDVVWGLGSLDYAAYNLVFNSFYNTLNAYLLWYGVGPYIDSYEDMPDSAFYNYSQQWSKTEVVGTTNTTIAWNLSFVVEISWPFYLDACLPAYCDISHKISVPRKLYLVFAELGGLASIAVLILQALLWPWLSFLIDSTKAAPPDLAITKNEEEKELIEMFVSGNDGNCLSKKLSSNPTINGMLGKNSFSFHEGRRSTPFSHTKEDMEKKIKKWSSNKW